MMKIKSYIYLLIILSNLFCATITHSQELIHDGKFDGTYIFHEPEKSDIKQDIIFGTLLSEDYKEPLAFVNIVVEVDDKTVTGTQTDFNGFYELHIPDTLDQFTIRMTYVGFHTKEIFVDRNSKPKVENESNEKNSTEHK